ncbi:hypothetical protein CY0110_18702 [Crocosphaera chwakensis CCY0110]|uniref:Uncharacterized protein n=1 Tax=Crocosphaera chwakensis CCY0110 TaxID=391612 RepID=A3IJ72_9CHRO|nr:hypothetical protein CY0110_18702 [Crocosphaera chwakensis CCY0110]
MLYEYQQKSVAFLKEKLSFSQSQIV